MVAFATLIKPYLIFSCKTTQINLAPLKKCTKQPYLIFNCKEINKTEIETVIHLHRGL